MNVLSLFYHESVLLSVIVSAIVLLVIVSILWLLSICMALYPLFYPSLFAISCLSYSLLGYCPVACIQTMMIRMR